MQEKSASLIGFSEFVRLCNASTESDFCPWAKLKEDGVYIVKPDESASLTPGELAALTEHPLKDLTKPVLSFPCTLEQLIAAMDAIGMAGCICEEELERFQAEGASLEHATVMSAAQFEKSTKNNWDEHNLRRLLDESRESGMTHKKLAEKYGVSRQQIGTQLKKAKDFFGARKATPFEALNHRSRKK
ncbi:hypothetical protein [Noviherbaspirillum sp. ST9]|uniref:hypothetical protein n=1 Tax=Noviherbaspirillum sp. ST9 TaxID=3401606 RepID=UPI003B588166